MYENFTLMGGILGQAVPVAEVQQVPFAFRTAAEAEYAQEFELYRAQEATSLDLATSEQSFADARRAVAEETLNRDVAALRVWYASGVMREALNLGANP